jgi:tungstate transport system substrate-binding protein
MDRLLILISVFTALMSLNAQGAELKLATTTSTENSGLLDYILPVFEKDTGIKLNVIAVGTGKALKLAENGDVDAVLVHAPAAEIAFIAAGFGVNRRAVMENDFVIAGPHKDPAALKDCGDIECAMKALCENDEAVFVSRGDDSGTHKKERFLWEKHGCIPPGERYLEVGQGMGAALRIADEKQAYTLSDRGTFLALKDTLEIEVLFEGADDLLNPYSVMAVNPARYRGVNYMEAMTFIAWLTSPHGQALIGKYKKHGQVLFRPVAVRPGQK